MRAAITAPDNPSATTTKPASGIAARPSGKKVIHPINPALIILPLNTALAGVGATGCAIGSQTCKPSNPALMPKPARRQPTTHPFGGGKLSNDWKTSGRFCPMVGKNKTDKAANWSTSPMIAIAR